MTVDQQLKRYKAALEVIRARDLVRETAVIGRATVVDQRRVLDADLAWEAFRVADRQVTR
jgi:hypothetical protein